MTFAKKVKDWYLNLNIQKRHCWNVHDDIEIAENEKSKAHGVDFVGNKAHGISHEEWNKPSSKPFPEEVKKVLIYNVSISKIYTEK